MPMIEKLIAASFAAAAAAGAGLVNTAAVAPTPAYGLAATSIEADAAARNSARVFERADLNNDGALDEEEFAVLAVVTAELARLNGFVPILLEGRMQTVALPQRVSESLTKAQKERIAERAQREFAAVAGDDERLVSHEFVGAALESFLSVDADRNGVLTGPELAAYAQGQSRLAAVVS